MPRNLHKVTVTAFIATHRVACLPLQDAQKLGVLYDYLYVGQWTEDIGRYPGHMTRDIAAMISRVICPAYLPISLGHVANHQSCKSITANNQIT